MMADILWNPIFIGCSAHRHGLCSTKATKGKTPEDLPGSLGDLEFALCRVVCSQRCAGPRRLVTGRFQRRTQALDFLE